MVNKKHKIREWCRLIMLVFTTNVNRLKSETQKDIKLKKMLDQAIKVKCLITAPEGTYSLAGKK